jgi:hypothetical protein
MLFVLFIKRIYQYFHLLVTTNHSKKVKNYIFHKTTKFIKEHRGFKTRFCGPLLVPESKFFNIRLYGSGPREDLFLITGTTNRAASEKSLKTTGGVPEEL